MIVMVINNLKGVIIFRNIMSGKILIGKISICVKIVMVDSMIFIIKSIQDMWIGNCIVKICVMVFVGCRIVRVISFWNCCIIVGVLYCCVDWIFRIM